ncbi:FliG C-terminal domain-containing protein [Propionivibrio sp.]|uniref:FliG C-terminal domain-containing protein n=1 Tax=Propionivibrio sp. TaxID=2212460 RepID=UPI003BEF771A
MSHAISLTLDNPAFQLEKQDYPPAYLLHLTQEGNENVGKVSIQLSPSAFEALLNQGTALVPSPEANLNVGAENVSWRETAWPLYRLEDRDWQLLLREMSSDALIRVLWFMKDLELARRAMRNFSERAAAMLTEDIIARFAGKNPDAVSASHAQDGRDSLREMLDVLARLQSEGQIQESC